jgi:Nucleotidyltransferase domain.
MSNLIEYADEIQGYISSLKEVRSCTLYGSLANNNFDEYSDIDIEIDVSGYDNSLFITRLSKIMAIKYPIIFCDYAPSLIPESYIVSIAINENNPFCIVDFKCVANPHYTTLNKQDFILDKVEHTMKVWTANCKHYLRGIDCYSDIVRMAKRVIGAEKISNMNGLEILNVTLNWLEQNCEERHFRYITNCRQFIE